jgi:cytochrome c oxidase subunit I
MSTTTAAASAPQPTRRPLWRRLLGFNLLSAIVLGIGGYYLGWFIGHQIGGPSYEYQAATDENDVALLLAYFFGVIGFLIGLGFANYPASRLLGRPSSLREKEGEGIGRYFGLCTDHKVVGIQYLVGIGVFFFVGGLNAMLIRTELLHPTPTFVGPNQYLSLVGMHGTMMMGMMTSGILGPFANYFVPILIGARRMAFPRIEALTFWLLMAAGFILTSTIFFGGFPTGWTGYEPLNDQAVMGMDSYIIFFALVGMSMALLGLNMIATISPGRGCQSSCGRCSRPRC